MDLKSQKDIAARLLKCGRSRVWLDPSRAADISEAITGRDIKRLIDDGVIKAKQKKGLSSFRKRKIMTQKRKGRRKGRGSRKGSLQTRSPRKTTWIRQIRLIRRTLKELKDTKKISSDVYGDLYRKASGGFFRNRRLMLSYMEKEKMLAKDDIEKMMTKKK